VETSLQFLKSLGIKDVVFTSRPYFARRPLRTLKVAYRYLQKLGLSDRAIAQYPQLLWLTKQRLETNYANLCVLGLGEPISKHPALLYRKTDTIKKHLAYLLEKGFHLKKIKSYPLLLISDPNTLEINWNNLRALGLTPAKIIVNPHLLQLRQQSIVEKYGLLRRYFAADFLAMFPSLLGMKKETIKSNLDLLHSLNINYTTNHLLLLSSAENKMKKIRWIEGNLGICPAPKDKNLSEKSQYVVDNSVLELIQAIPRLLIYSIATLQTKEDKLKLKLKNIQKLHET